MIKKDYYASNILKGYRYIDSHVNNKISIIFTFLAQYPSCYTSYYFNKRVII